MPKAPLPASVGISHFTYRIEQLSKKKARQLAIDGDCHFQKRRIRVAPASTGIERANYLLHETLHGCWDAAQLGTHEDEETAVNSLANVLVQVIRDNPEFWRYIEEQCRETDRPHSVPLT